MALLAVAGALAYLSFIPFRFHPMAVGDAWSTFLVIPTIEIGGAGRIDWIANILMYLPLGFFGAAALESRSSGWPRFTTWVIAFAIGTAWAIAVEFGQLFFSGRTVSLNDIAAESIGTGLGVLFWAMYGSLIGAWWVSLNKGGATTLNAIIGAYVVIYLGLSVFPFDFILSTRELQEKMNSAQFALGLASHACERVGCLAHLIAESVVVIPLGLAWALRWRGNARALAITAMFAGLGLGLLIETAQIFMLSGITQGASVLTRGVGMLAGAIAWQHRTMFRLAQSHCRIAVVVAALPYLIAVGWVNGWLHATWIPLESALSRATSVNLLPFYYFYFESETAAVASTLVYALLYAPIGLAAWCWLRNSARNARPWAFLLGGSLATAMEAGKLFHEGRHPDPTDILIGACSAWLIAWLCGILSKDEWQTNLLRGDSNVPPPTADSARLAMAAPRSAWTLAVNGAGIVLLAIVLWSVREYPVYRGLLAIALASYGLLLKRWRWLYLVIVPVAVPIFDLAPLSGRYFWDEFDFLLGTTLGVRWLRYRDEEKTVTGSIWPSLLVVMLLLSGLSSALIGLLPMSPIDANAFSNYYSHMNALRAIKGLVAAGAMYWIMRVDTRAGIDVQRWLLRGLTVGLLAASISVFWERAMFSNLLDFRTDYRVAGLFSSMHTGGAYIDGFLVLALPGAVACALGGRSRLERVGCSVIAVLGIYPVAVTFSRGAVAGAVLAFIVFAAGLLVFTRRARLNAHPSLMRMQFVLIAGIAVVTALPIMFGPFARNRLSSVGSDLSVRIEHWRGAVQMMDRGAPTFVFGMGAGRYPSTYAWRNTEGIRPANFHFEREGPSTFLRLGTGNPLYFEQIIDVKPGAEYTLTVRLRSTGELAMLRIPICEKALLYSFDCQWLVVSAPPSAGGEWSEQRVFFNSKRLGSGPWLLRRPVKLALYNASASTAVDVAEVTVVGEGRDLVSNGHFAAGMDHWFFTTDNHLPWHLKNMGLHIFFEQGMVGLLLFSALLIMAVRRLALHASVRLEAVALLASITGCICVGMFDSVIDAPRMNLLFFTLILSALVSDSQQQATTRTSFGNVHG